MGFGKRRGKKRIGGDGSKRVVGWVEGGCQEWVDWQIGEATALPRGACWRAPVGTRLPGGACWSGLAKTRSLERGCQQVGVGLLACWRSRLGLVGLRGQGRRSSGWPSRSRPSREGTSRPGTSRPQPSRPGNSRNELERWYCASREGRRGGTGRGGGSVGGDRQGQAGRRRWAEGRPAGEAKKGRPDEGTAQRREAG
jgi:hypothetical protein